MFCLCEIVRLEVNKLCYQMPYKLRIRAMNYNGNLICDRDDVIVCYSKNK